MLDNTLQLSLESQEILVVSLYVLVKFAQISIGSIHKLKTQGAWFPSFINIHQTKVEDSKFPITKNQLPTFPNLITLFTHVLNVDAIEHVSTKQHPQVLNVQASINDTNHHALEVFHVLDTNVDFVDVKEVISNLMKR